MAEERDGMPKGYAARMIKAAGVMCKLHDEIGVLRAENEKLRTVVDRLLEDDPDMIGPCVKDALDDYAEWKKGVKP